MVGNLVVNAILAAVLYGLFLWTPWASLAVSLLSTLAFGYIFIFDKSHVDNIAKEMPDQLSLLLGAGISCLGVVVSVVALMS